MQLKKNMLNGDERKKNHTKKVEIKSIARSQPKDYGSDYKMYIMM